MENAKGKKEPDEGQEKKASHGSDAKKGYEKIAELTDTLKRLQAEFENYKKRADREKEIFSKNASIKLIEKMLPLLDSFELAIKNSNSSDFEKFKKGVEMIYSQFYSILQNEGLRPIEALGRQFDPYKHEVLMQEESDRDNVVIEEFQKGYMLNENVLRHSKVKVGRKKECKDDGTAIPEKDSEAIDGGEQQ